MNLCVTEPLSDCILQLLSSVDEEIKNVLNGELHVIIPKET